MIASVLVDLNIEAVNHTFDYVVPNQLIDKIQVGVRVEVSFGSRTLMGIVLKIDDIKEQAELKPIIDVLDITPVLSEEMLDLGKKVALDTGSNLITVYLSMLPKPLRKKYHQIVRVTDDAPQIVKETHLEKKNIVSSFDKGLLNKGLLEGWLSLEIESKGAANIKYEKIYSIDDSINFENKKAIEECTSIKINDNQKAVLCTLFKEELTKKEIVDKSGVSQSVVENLVKRGLLKQTLVEKYRLPLLQFSDKINLEKLNDQQNNVFDTIWDSKECNNTFLLHGVTGSGKTAVYLKLIEKMLYSEKQSLVLIPEIALTQQIIGRFVGQFGAEKIAVLHSNLSDGERFDSFRRILRNEAKIIIGTRSAIFAPFVNLGIIIIDEEHDTSYKQQDNPKYHAIEVAKHRAEYFSCPLVLGSATPSLDSFARAKRGVYKLLELSKRYNENKLPKVQVVDMKEQYRKGNTSILSTDLVEAIREKLNKKEQIILLYNRRGYSSVVYCRDCGESYKCPHCEVTLTYHKQEGLLKCHYCGYMSRPNSGCKTCNSTNVFTEGSGIQKAEELLKQLFSDAKIIRMDKDTTSGKNKSSLIIENFGKGEGDILLGTQMVAKGFDFENVTLVGVISADFTLNIPSFDSAERTFQLVTQVAGRSGRASKSGEVIIQTYSPEHYSIEFAKNHDYESFYKQEMEFRKTLAYPPYTFMAFLKCFSMDEQYLDSQVAKLINYLKTDLQSKASILGPTKPYVKRVSQKYIREITIKYRDFESIAETLKQARLLFNDKKFDVFVDNQYIK